MLASDIKDALHALNQPVTNIPKQSTPVGEPFVATPSHQKNVDTLIKLASTKWYRITDSKDNNSQTNRYFTTELSNNYILIIPYSNKLRDNSMVSMQQLGQMLRISTHVLHKANTLHMSEAAQRYDYGHVGITTDSMISEYMKLKLLAPKYKFSVEEVLRILPS